MSEDKNNSGESPEQIENNFVHLFGKNPTVIFKVLETLMEHPTYPYNKKELADINDVHPDTVYKYWDTLEDYNLVDIDKVQGGTKLFTLRNNTDYRDECGECGQLIDEESRKPEDKILEHLYKLSEAVREYRDENNLNEE